MADQLDINQLMSLDTSGNPVAGAKAYFFATGTTTPLTVYANAALSSAHATPLVANSGGVFAAVYYGAATGAKVRVDTSAGATLYTIDPVRRIAGDATGASSITFAPTTDIPASDVQAAIERVQANASVNFEVITKTAGYTVVVADKTKLIRCTNALTLALTAAATLGDGFTFYVKSIGGVVVTIDPAGSETVDGAATLVVNGWARVFCDGANWHTTPVAEVLDEDNMASDDPLSVPTQQSAKAYIDADAIVQRVITETVAHSSFTGGTLIPIDDTKPQSNEGSEVVSVAITPTASGNRLWVHVLAMIGHSVNGGAVPYSIIRSGAADAISAGLFSVTSNNAPYALDIWLEIAAGTTDAVTFSLRVSTASGTGGINGINTGRIFGGSAVTQITVTEVKA